MGTIFERNITGNSTLSVNGVVIKEIRDESDFPAPVGGEIDLVANTTYLIRGSVSITNLISITADNIAILGSDREKDGLSYTGSSGAGDFITIQDVNCEIANLKLSSTNNTGGDVVLRATNFNYGAYNDGRNKVLTITNCQFRNVYDVSFIEGFDLVDISNTLFWYSQASSIGCQFKNISKLQISSCEFVRWFQESSIPTPANYATVPMIEFLANGAGNGNGAVNINGCIIHPQQTQDGIKIDTSSTTAFGTISSSAFVSTGLTTGKVFLPEVPILLLPDYSQTATYNYDVFANQGILNSTSGCVMTLTGNTTVTALGGADPNPNVVNTGGGAVVQAAVRYTVDASGRCTYNGTKSKYVSIHASLSYTKQGAGTDDYTFYLYKNGTLLAGSGLALVDVAATSSLALNYGTLMNQNDYIEIYVENTSSTDDMLVTDWQVVIRE